MGLFRPERRAVPFTFGDLPQRGSLRASAGVVVTDDVAFAQSAVWACVWKYAKIIKSLPFAGYRDVSGISTPLAATPPVMREPEPGMRFRPWVSQVVVSLMLRGNAFGLILGRNTLGLPTGVQILHPDLVAARYDYRTGAVEYRVGGVVVDPSSIWHTAINVGPGSPFGLSPMGAARQAIGMGAAAHEYGSGWFANGGLPTGVLEGDVPFTQEQAAQLKERFKAAVSGNDVAVLGLGVRYHAIQTSPQDAEFLNAYKVSAQDVCRFFDMPPEMIGLDSGTSMTYSNVESRAVDLLRYSIDGVVVDIEEAVSELLPRPQYVKANRSALLRMTTIDRYTAHEKAIRAGWRSVNEVRAMEDLPPVADGNEFLWPPFAVSEPPSPDPAGSAIPTETMS